MVSIILPCYNYGKYLGEALDSVFSQTYTNWECIIIDDGSTDNSRDVALSYHKRDERFKYHYQKNKGTSAAKNKGLDIARGEFIQFLDADDLLSKDKLYMHINLILSSKSDLVFSSFEYFGKSKENINSNLNLNDEYAQINDFKSELIQRNLFVISSPLFRRTAHRFNTKLNFCEDWLFWFQLIKNPGYGVTFDWGYPPMTAIRIHDESISNSSFSNIRGNFFTSKKILALLPKSDLEDKMMGSSIYGRNRKFYINYINNCLFQSCKNHDIARVIKWGRFCLLVNPNLIYYLKNSFYWWRKGIDH